MQGRGSGSPACSTPRVSETFLSFILRNIMGQKHRAVCSDTKSLEDEEGTESRGEAKDRQGTPG